MLIDVPLILPSHQLVHELVLRRENHVGGTKEGVGAGGENVDPEFLACRALGTEGHLCTTGTADPVALHCLDLVGPVEQLQVVEKPVRVGGDAHHPLTQTLAEDRVVAALRTTVRGDLLVCQHRSQARAPVDHGVRQVDEAVFVDSLLLLRRIEVGVRAAILGGAGACLKLANKLLNWARLLLILIEPGIEDLQEDPLRPLVKLRVRGGHRATTVVAQAQRVQLTRHVLNIRHRGRARVRTRLDGVLLRRQTESVVAKRVQHVLAQHAVVAREDIRRDVAQRMTHVQARAGGVGEHVLDIELVSRQIALTRS